LLAAQQNPTSPSFHQWLTPAQYADRFGISQADVNQVSAWLQAQGFSVVETPPSRTWIVLSGTAAQVESALHTEIHNYAANGKAFFANSSEPSVPAALANITLGFRGLSNYPIEPRAIRKIEGGTDQPNFTSSISGTHFVAPDDFATIYDVKSLYAGTPAIDGTGQRIAIVGQSNIVLADVAAFRTASGLSPNVPTLVLVPGSTDPGVLSITGDEQESSIDVEWAGAVARNASILFVYANSNTGGVFDAMQYAIGNNLAPVISISYGSCEPVNSSSEINALVALAQQANALGITIAASSGDGGATDCDGFFHDYPAQNGLNVDVPASLPYVTGVGGSEFSEGNGAYWNTANNVNNGSALSYIPEMAWDDSSSANGLAAGGGGASTVFGKPVWQTGTGVPADGVRDVPDISLNA
jgi:subtilase family serine protease